MWRPGKEAAGIRLITAERTDSTRSIPDCGRVDYSVVESCKANKVNPLTYLTYVLSHVRDRRVTLLTPDEFLGSDLTQIG
jgi:hypothetical protein